MSDKSKRFIRKIVHYIKMLIWRLLEWIEWE